MNKFCLFTLTYKTSGMKLLYEVQREELAVTSCVLPCCNIMTVNV